MLQNITSINKGRRTSKAGKEYGYINITTDKHNNTILSGYTNKDNEGWQVGTEVDIDIKQNGQYMNFIIAGVKKTVSREELDALKADIQKLKEEIAPLSMKRLMSSEAKSPQKEYDTTKKEDRDHVMSVIDKKPDIEFDDNEVPI